MDVFLATLGCRLNEAELESWSRAFSGAGHRVVARAGDAQVMVLNSCAVTTEAARKSRQHVHRMHRANPSARLVVTGCYASLEPERVAALAGVDAVIDNADKDALVARLERDVDVASMPELATAPDGAHVYRAGRTRAFVKVQDGCRHRCTFCIVTVARGEERSRPVAAVVDEINRLHADGFQEAVLTGVHLGGYGHDRGTDLRALVGAILRDTDIPRLRLSSLEPWNLPEDFFALWDDPRLMPHLHLPLQSGADPVLRKMARRCTTAEFAALARRARGAIPDLSLTTDLIVGFPGETDADHAATLDFVESVGFAHIHVFSYSVRPGTAAARMPGHLPNDVKKARSRDAHALAARLKRDHLQRFLGQTRDVLFETGGGGYTDNYLRVQAPADIDNQILPVTLARIAPNGEGYEVDAPAGARVATPRVRLRVI